MEFYMTKKTSKKTAKKKAAKVGGYATKKALKRSVLAAPMSEADVQFAPTPGLYAPLDYNDGGSGSAMSGGDYIITAILIGAGLVVGFWLFS
jgi:hypothetical protein